MTPFASLLDVKRWLNITTITTDDDVLKRLILSASGYVRGWLNRDIEYMQYTESYSGIGGTRLSLLNTPIFAINSLLIDGLLIPAKTTATGNGYAFTNNQVILNGYTFTRGVENIDIIYEAGFVATQSATIPATEPYTVATNYVWTSDIEVLDNTLAPVAHTVVDGVYTFDMTDAGKAIIIRYGYIPAEITQAVIDVIGRKYREKTRIGEVSKRVGGEVVRFTESDLSDDTKSMLNQFRRLTPL